MPSKNHQFVEFEGNVVARYVKTMPQMLTGYRIDPHHTDQRIDWLLASPDNHFRVIWIDGQQPRLERETFSYDDEVIELYSEVEKRAFERLNRPALEAGLLAVYTETAPVLDTVNILSDIEIDKIAAIKQLSAFKKRVGVITSIPSLNRIRDAVERNDRPVSILRAVSERIHELSTNT